MYSDMVKWFQLTRADVDGRGTRLDYQNMER